MARVDELGTRAGPITGIKTLVNCLGSRPEAPALCLCRTPRPQLYVNKFDADAAGPRNFVDENVLGRRYDRGMTMTGCGYQVNDLRYR